MTDRKGFWIVIAVCGIVGLYFGFVQHYAHQRTVIDPHQKIIDRCEAAVMKAHRMEREYIELHFRIQAEKINNLIEQNKKMALELSRLRRENFSVNNGRDNSAPERR